MKLLRQGPKDRERPALIDTECQVRDLGALLGHITPATLSSAGLAARQLITPSD